MECDILYFWIKKWSHMQKSHQENDEPQGYSWERWRRSRMSYWWLKLLLWLPVKTWIQYKIACLCFLCIRTACHLIFLTFFIHTVPLWRCALLTPLCWQFLASLLRPLGKDLSLFLDPLFGTHYHCPSEKHSVLQLLEWNSGPINFTFIFAEVQVLVSVCISQEVCVCVCDH